MRSRELFKLDRYLTFAICLFFVLFTNQVVRAGTIPYPNAGLYNPTTYSFNAISTGNIFAYYAGSSASYENEIGILINGILSSSGYGLNNHTSEVGDFFDLGYVNAGDEIIFVLHNLSPLGLNAYSDPSMNIAYDQLGATLHNHIYATSYSGQIAGISVTNGIYIGFEDLQFPNSNYNYFDETFVFTNVAIDPVPEPASLALFGVGIMGLGYLKRYKSNKLNGVHMKIKG